MTCGRKSNRCSRPHPRMQKEDGLGWMIGKHLRQASMCCAQVSNGMRCRGNWERVQQYITAFKSGSKPVSSRLSGKPDWKSTMRYKGSSGNGKQLTEQ